MYETPKEAEERNERLKKDAAARLAKNAKWRKERKARE